MLHRNNTTRNYSTQRLLPVCLPLLLTVLARPSPRHRERCLAYLRRECHLLAVKFALDVVVEEVKVQYRLDDASDPHNPVTVALLRHVAPNPVEQVECPVHAHAEHVVPCQHIGNLRTSAVRVRVSVGPIAGGLFHTGLASGLV